MLGPGDKPFDFSRLDIAFVAGTLGNGGAERQLYYILRSLSRKGARVRLFTLGEGEHWEEAVKGLGITVTCFGKHKSRITRFVSLVSALARDSPDIVQSQHFYTNLYAAVAARVIGAIGIGAIRSSGLWEEKSLGWPMGKLSLCLPHVMCVNSQSALVHSSRIRKETDKCFFLPNVSESINHRVPVISGEEGELCVLGLGRLVWQKRFDRFLVVLARARSLSKVPIRARIVGDGPLRLDLERQATSLGLSKIVTFQGSVSDATEAILESDVLLLTSDHEGCPNAAIEAMASGLPVVSTSVGGLPELVIDGVTGFSAAPSDSETLAKSLVSLAESTSLRAACGERGKKRIIERHSVQAMERSLSENYQRLLPWR